MRKFICLLFFVILTSLGYSLGAQEKTGRFYKIDVNGVPLSAHVTKSQVIQKFGHPDRYEQQDSEFGLAEYYYYGDGYLLFENQEFIEFTVTKPEFRLLTIYFNGGIRVGDPLNVFDNFEGGDLILSDEDSQEYMIVNDSDSHLEITADNGKIKSFHFHYLP